LHSSPNGNHYDRPGHHDPQRRQLHSPKSNPQSDRLLETVHRAVTAIPKAHDPFWRTFLNCAKRDSS
jgi:hypothetical protein